MEEELNAFIVGSMPNRGQYVKQMLLESLESLGYSNPNTPDVEYRLRVIHHTWPQYCDQNPILAQYIFFVLLRAFPAVRNSIRSQLVRKDHFDSFWDYVEYLLVAFESSEFYAFNAGLSLENIVVAIQSKWKFLYIELIDRSKVPQISMLKNVFDVH
jgi:hypothetical protein